MSWSLYRWVWHLESPLFIGMPPSGSLNRCRLYVPARAIWGALTAELARQKMGTNSQSLDAYKNVGQRLLNMCRFSYLYPATLVDGGWLAWLPCFEQGKGLHWRREDKRQCISDDEFRRRLLDARPGTAIDSTASTADEGSLHETECIGPFWTASEGQTLHRVGLVGYLFCGNETLLRELQAVTELFVGGDTRYGLGSMRRDQLFFKAGKIFGSEVDCEAEEPRVKSRCVLAHASVGSANQLVVGGVEVLKGWDHEKLVLIDKAPSWMPGSQLRDGEGWWSVKEDGRWECN